MSRAVSKFLLLEINDTIWREDWSNFHMLTEIQDCLQGSDMCTLVGKYQRFGGMNIFHDQC
jgi:hypothetical protein